MLPNQGAWKGASGSPSQSPAHSHQSHHSQSPGHTSYNAQSSYFAPSTTSGQHSPNYAAPPAANDDPFRLKDSDNPFSGALTGHAQVVPVAPHTTVTVDSGAASGNVVLQFQDTNLHQQGASPKGKIGGEVPRVHVHGEQAHAVGNGGEGPESSGGGKFFFLNIKRYRQYFNVDTNDVLVRMRDSVFGSWKADFFEKTTENADLYGPFWVATTLIFVSAVTGNYANYVSYKRKHAESASVTDPAWYYDINKVSYSAILFYGYVGIIGLLLYACLRWWFKSNVSLAQVWCIYGYSLSIYIPISFFCIFPYESVRWTLVVLATFTSGLFLLTNFKGPIFDVAGAKATPIFLSVAAAHIALGLAMKLYFFHYW